MASGRLRTWLSVVIGAAAIGGITVLANQPPSPDARQTSALASLSGPAAPGSFALAHHEGDALSNATCATDLDKDVQPLTITFARGSTALLPEHTALLSHIAALITSCKDAHLQIAGHASGDGDDQSNLAISWARADETLAALVALGVDTASLEAIGYGARAPLAQGSDDDSATNARVDFRVIPRRD